MSSVLAVRRLLGGASLEPAGLSPAAFLVVRSLSVPGRLVVRPGAVRLPAAWERGARAALEARWRSAVRPAVGPVSPAAEAVLFADAAELCAAFARDVCAGDAGRWWWRALLRGLPADPLAALVALWVREARAVPAALEALAASGDAVRVVGALSGRGVGRVLGAMAAAWGVDSVLAGAPSVMASASPSVGVGPSGRSASAIASASPVAGAGGDASSGAASRGSSLTTYSTFSPGAVPPWRGFLPEGAVPPSLDPSRAALLGLGRMLVRAPLVARSAGFAERFRVWVAAGRAVTTIAGGTGGGSGGPAASPESVGRAGDDGGWGVDSPRTVDSERGEEGSSSVEPAMGGVEGVLAGRFDGAEAPGPVFDVSDLAGAAGDASADAEGGGGHLPRVVDERVGGGGGRSEKNSMGSVGLAGGGRSAKVGEDADAEGGDALPRVEVVVPAEVGAACGGCGVFFLVNVLRSMGFWRLLESHFRVPPVIGGWGWVELVARGLLGPRAAGLADDPVWRVLAALDGRGAEEAPGGGFLAPEEVRLPAEWEALFPRGAPRAAPSPPLGIVVVPALGHVLDVVVPVVSARISAALVAAGGDAGERLETALFRRTGTVLATRTHVDVRMDADQVTLPVRMAGLDADPGWVPELARVVAFHFG